MIKEILSLDHWDEFDLLGYSMGGRLGLHVAHALSSTEQSSSSLQQLIVVSASLGIYCPDERRERRSADRGWSDPLWERGDLDHFLEVWNRQPILAQLGERNPEEALRLFSHRLTHKARGLATALDVLGQGVMPPLQSILPSIKIPVMWVAGSEDVKYAQIAQEASALCPQGELSLIEGCGHSPHLENLNRFHAQLIDQLNGGD